MELKRIIARDSRSANEKAIQLYGQDVLIISSHKVDNQIELVVAVETEDSASATAQAPSFKPMAAPVSMPAPAQPSGHAPAFSSVLQTEMVTPSAAPLPTPSADNEHDLVMDALTALSRRVASPTEQAAASAVAPLPAAQPAAAALTEAQAMHDFRRSQETVELLRQEMLALRQEFALSRQMAVWQGGLGLSPDVEQLWHQLLDLGIPARLRSLLLDSVRNLESVDEARAMVYRLLTDALQRAVCPVPEQGVHALCGPSGAGKSSMAVRLARHAASRLNAEQQAIISYCDQRPGAWSQLQVLAAQTGIECYKATDIQTLKLLLDDLSGRKAIWIDTPGTDFLAHAETLRSAAPEVQLHAVLPVDASVTSVQKVLETPAQSWSTLMLSKLDEAAHPWPLIQGLCNKDLAVSLVSQSASVAGTIGAFDPDQLVAMALAPLGEIAAVVPRKKPVRKRVGLVESAAKPVAKRSRSTAKVLNA